MRLTQKYNPNIVREAMIAFCGVEVQGEEFFRSKLKRKRTLFLKENLTPDNITRLKRSLECCNILVVSIYSRLNTYVLSKLPKLMFVATMSTGYDHISLEDCAKKGITVSNVPSYAEDSVAEHTIALILAFSRKIYEALTRTRSGIFSREGLIGFELKGKTLGMVGVGRIGEKVVELAKAFGMNVIAYDPLERKQIARRLGFRYVSLDTLLRNADIISIHAPLNKQTYHLINRRNIQSVKKGTCLINTARAAIVETTALRVGLEKGILSGVALDVLESESFISKPKLLRSKFATRQDIAKVKEERILLKNRNVIVTPHSAYYSKEAVTRRSKVTLDNIEHFMAGKPVNVIASS